jgi:putative membrane protein
MFLSRSEIEALDARIAALEAASGVEVVTAVIGKADAYPEVPWKAFAVGAAVAALATVVVDALRPDWASAHAALRHAVAILGVGGAAALGTVFVPAWARLYLRPARRDVEVAQYAKALFVEREVFRTRDRTGVLVLVSLFERRIELLPDTGFRDRVTTADWHAVVPRMTPQLAAGRAADALQEGLAALGDVLARRGFHRAPGRTNELPDRPLERKGEA